MNPFSVKETLILMATPMVGMLFVAYGHTLWTAPGPQPRQSLPPSKIETMPLCESGGGFRACRFGERLRAV